jgi:hypothetical protein
MTHPGAEYGQKDMFFFQVFQKMPIYGALSPISMPSNFKWNKVFIFH